MLLEVACFNIESAAAAIETGAQRIEFCSDRASGGLTPERFDDIQASSKISGPRGPVPINVMIRSNPSMTFTASTAEKAQMRAAVAALRPFAAGFVFGVLRDDGTIDVETCTELVSLASPRPCTFHRAFDHARHTLAEKAGIVRRCGFTRILSSGGLGDAIHGKAELRQLIGESERLGLEVIIGGGVRSRNIAELANGTGGQVFHTAAITSNSDTVDTREIGLILGEMARAGSLKQLL